ncbi:MAG: class I SAM-dependent methyltransferase [Bacteroidetes bacterium]|nr:class I SAM-dependent methyltransferase [Bacteroidota bacterium]MCY4225990.1 class I SAM-dependent methyltransferase [Bacteroidota bacterium]
MTMGALPSNFAHWKGWNWISLLGLFGSIAGLAFVSGDRTNLPIVFALIVFGCVCWFISWRWGSFRLWTILLCAVLFRLLLFATPPSLSDDAYRYIWDGLIQHEGLNPYQFAPEDVPVEDLKQDPSYKNLNSKSFISVYPPVSQFIFWLGTHWHDPSHDLSYYLIKGFLVLAEMMAIFLLARMVSSGFVLFYAWNPVIIMETAGQAHTESALLLALALVIYLAKMNYSRWASICLSLAGWIKLYPFLFFPFLWRRFGWHSVWSGVLVAVLVALPFVAPYVLMNVSGSLDLYARFFEFNSGLYYAIKESLLWVTGDDWSKQLGPFLRVVFLCGVPLLYLLDRYQNWSLAQACLITTGAYFVLTTTIHPWYLLIPLFLIACLQMHGWHWVWLAICSMGTYLLYVDGPYWIFVILGWSGWTIGVIIRYYKTWIQTLLRYRSKTKFKRLRPFIPMINAPLHVLDLGCAEGYLGQQIHDQLGARVILSDIESMNQTTLPHHQLKSGPLPWPPSHFDVVVLYYVLHHAKDPEALLREALRISNNRVMVVESVYTTSFQLQCLKIIDRIANRLRSFGKMNAQEKYLDFRSSQQWRKIFDKCHSNIIGEFKSGFGPFCSVGFILKPQFIIHHKPLNTHKINSKKI